MNLLQLPWLDVSLVLLLAGAVGVSQVRSPDLAYRCGRALAGLAFFCTFLAWLSFYLHWEPGADAGKVQDYLFGGTLFELDEVNAPLVPAIALLHFLTAVATTQARVRRFSSSWSLATAALHLATFSCTNASVLVGLLAAGAVPPCVELLNEGKPIRLYVLHMGLFVALLVGGWSLLAAAGDGATEAASVLVLAAVLIRCGTAPAHCWVIDWLENATFGIGLLSVAPLVGVYAAVRLVLPTAPDWALQGMGIISLTTALYAAGMATVQREVRRFFAYLFLSHASLVLVGLELHSPLSLTGALCLWFSVLISLAGFGLTLRALESRFGRLSLGKYHGLYDHVPTLAVCFLLMGLGSVGFPGTLGFISAEMLVDGVIGVNVTVGLAVVAVAACNGIAIVRAYFLLFTGTRHVSTVSLRIVPRERFAVLTLAAILLGGGLFPQPGVASRERAAETILESRQKYLQGNTEVRQIFRAASLSCPPHGAGFPG